MRSSSFGRKTTVRPLPSSRYFACSTGNPRLKFRWTDLKEAHMWNLPPADSVLHFLQYVALAAQAMTAALAAGRRSMDWAGVCMLGAITALGGGTIRDGRPG